MWHILLLTLSGFLSRQSIFLKSIVFGLLCGHPCSHTSAAFLFNGLLILIFLVLHFGVLLWHVDPLVLHVFVCNGDLVCGLLLFDQLCHLLVLPLFRQFWRNQVFMSLGTWNDDSRWFMYNLSTLRQFLFVILIFNPRLWTSFYFHDLILFLSWFSLLLRFVLFLSLTLLLVYWCALLIVIGLDNLLLQVRGDRCRVGQLLFFIAERHTWELRRLNWWASYLLLINGLTSARVRRIILSIIIGRTLIIVVAVSKIRQKHISIDGVPSLSHGIISWTKSRPIVLLRIKII